MIVNHILGLFCVVAAFFLHSVALGDAIHRSVLDQDDDSVGSDYDGGSENITPMIHLSLPNLDETDTIQIYHLRSFTEQLIKISMSQTSFGIKTSGLALRSTMTGQVIVLEYRPMDFEASFLPIVVLNTTSAASNADSILNGNGNTDGDFIYDNSPSPSKKSASSFTSIKSSSGGGQPLSPSSSSFHRNERGNLNLTYGDIYWDKRASLQYWDKIDPVHWQHSTFLGNINGVVYENYIKWLDDYVEQHPVFIPQSICSSPDQISPDQTDSSCFQFSHTWENFISASLQQFASMSVELHAMLPPRAQELQVLSNTEPTILYTNAQLEGTGHLDGDNSRKQHHTTSASTILTKDKETVKDLDLVLGSRYSESMSHTGEVVEVSESDMAGYYSEMIACMNAYTLEDFTSALRSCMIGEHAYIHIQGNKYYKISPRHPFAVDQTYFVSIPQAIYAIRSPITWVDISISILLLVTVSVGLILSVSRLKLIEACFYSKIKDARAMSSSFRFSFDNFGNQGISQRNPRSGYDERSSELDSMTMKKISSATSEKEKSTGKSSAFNTMRGALATLTTPSPTKTTGYEMVDTSDHKIVADGDDIDLLSDPLGLENGDSHMRKNGDKDALISTTDHRQSRLDKEEAVSTPRKQAEVNFGVIDKNSPTVLNVRANFSDQV
jgi:hypothetical protein